MAEPNSLSTIANTLVELGKKIDKTGEQSTKLAEKVAELEKPRTTDGNNPDRVFGLPNARTGEDPMTSRGFSYVKLAGVKAGILQPEMAKVEMDICSRMQQKLHHPTVGFKSSPASNVTMFGPNREKMELNFSASSPTPFGCDYLPEQIAGEPFAMEVKSLVGAWKKPDPEEMMWLRRHYAAPGQKSNVQSWLDETLGGSLVPPPEMGELINLLRNKEALINAGVRTIPLPPQGRMVFPRQTSATTGYYLGESSQITQSTFGTGQLVLSAKKVACLVQLPNELIRFGGPAAEALLREDMTKTLALTMDFQLLQGSGSDNVPNGLINTDGVVPLTASQVGVNGDTFLAQDIYQFPSAIMENNAEMEGYIVRPRTFWQLIQMRSATGAGPSSGLFMFNPIRGLDGKFGYVVGGMPAVLTPQISNARVKGTSSNLTYIIGGMWSDYILGMFGAIEFTATAVGDTSFSYDQTWVKAILSHDGGPRHPAAFAYMDNLAAFSG